MHNAMLGLFNLGGGEIILILFLLMLMGGGSIAVVLIALWIFAKQRNPTPAAPPIHPTNPVPPPRTCPRCGAPLPPDAPEGLCPRCVLGVGLATHTDATGEVGAPGARIPQSPLPAAEIARHFPQLEILECLGRGGMGAVYKARQPKLNRLVALKILAPEKGADPKFAERFLREAQALARLSHPNIVTVHDFGEADGLYYLLMEYVDGVTLRQLLQSRKIVPEEALRIVPKICEALQFAHEQGIVHRDIKPENVLLDKQGRVKIADFGIAKLVGAEAPRLALTEEQSVIGTPHYMAPEQVEKPQSVDHRADIFSLGVVFYEMLTGELPLGKFQPPSQKVQMDVRLDEVVLHALEKEPERRYQHASQVKTDVETIAASPRAPAGAGNAATPVIVKSWRDCWPWAEIGTDTGPAAAAPQTGRAWKLFAIVLAAVLLILGIPVGAIFLHINPRHLSRKPARVAAYDSSLAARADRFGPVREATLNDMDDLRGGEALDFDSGTLLDLPKDIKQQPASERLQWLKDQGVDLLLDRVGGSWGLMTTTDNELKLASLPNEGWGTPSESALSRALAAARTGLEIKQHGPWLVYVLPTNGQPPLTFAFGTANGTTGLLQITGFTEKPNSARLRYKLVQPSGKTSQLDALSEADRARAVALFNDIEDFGHEFEAAFTAKNLAAAQTGTRRLLTLLTNFNSVVRGTGCEFPAALLNDVGKVQAALEEGDWDKVKEAARFNEAYAREFRRISRQMVELFRR